MWGSFNHRFFAGHTSWEFSSQDRLGLLHLARVSAAVVVVGRAVAAAAVVDAVAVLVALAVGRAVLTLLDVLFGQPLALHVRLHPEVGEEHEEEGSVHPYEVEDHGVLVVTAVQEVILGGVERHQHKLDLLGRNQESATYLLRWINLCARGYTYELNGGHVFLPPQIFLEARSSS